MRFLLLSLALFSGSAVAAEPTYWQDVRPLMRKHCTVCHSQKTINEPDVSGGLALDTPEAILKGTKTPVVKKGNGAESLLVTILRHPKPTRRMPLDADPLSDDTVAMLKRWIDSGMPEGEKPKETDVAIVTTPGKTRKLDIQIPTKLPVPKDLAKPKQVATMELVLPVGPLAPITALAFSPDGKQLAAGCYGRVVIWDVEAGKPAKVLTNVLGAVNDLRYSPDGKILAVAGGQPSARGDVRLFSTADWKLQGTLGGHLDVVSAVSFDPAGKQLATASFDKTVRIWDLETRKPILDFNGHSDFVYGVAFGTNGDWFVTASKDRTSRMVETKTGKSVFTFAGREQDVLAVAVQPGGEQVVTSGFEPALDWWNPKTGERAKRQAGHTVATYEIGFTPKGDLAFSAGADGTVKLWDPKTGMATKTFPVGSTAFAAAIRPDGKLIASGSFDGLVRIWDVDAVRQVAALLATPEGGWLVQTPEGWCDLSDDLAARARWRAASQEVPAAVVWKAARRDAEVRRALKLEKLGEPTFAAPAP